MLITNKVFFDGGAAGGTEPPAADENLPAVTTEEAAFETWLANQTPAVRDELEKHTKGLVSALKKERAAASSVPSLKTKVKEFEDAQETQRKSQLTKEEALASDLAQSQAREAALASE